MLDLHEVSVVVQKILKMWDYMTTRTETLCDAQMCRALTQQQTAWDLQRKDSSTRRWSKMKKV